MYIKADVPESDNDTVTDKILKKNKQTFLKKP